VLSALGRSLLSINVDRGRDGFAWSDCSRCARTPARPTARKRSQTRAAPITPSPSVTGHPWRRGLKCSRLP